LVAQATYEYEIIKDCFGAHRASEYLRQHKLDMCIVYGCEPRVLAQAPGGRHNAKFVCKASFEALAPPGDDGEYFLRPDRIFGLLLLDPAHPPQTEHAEAARLALREERQRDRATMLSLTEVQLEAAREEEALLAHISVLEAERRDKVCRALQCPLHLFVEPRFRRHAVEIS
jgi:hypothetical protein